jgi:hypothetical protein
LHYDENIDKFSFRPTPDWRKQNNGRKNCTFIGDVADEAHERLVKLLRSRGKLTGGGLDMEPFEVLRDMIRSGEYPTIGGSPQIAKVYKYMRTQIFAVKWPDGSGTPHLLGRPALSYESLGAAVIDPDNPTMHKSKP